MIQQDTKSMGNLVNLVRFVSEYDRTKTAVCRTAGKGKCSIPFEVHKCSVRQSVTVDLSTLLAQYLETIRIVSANLKPENNFLDIIAIQVNHCKFDCFHSDTAVTADSLA